MNKLLEQLEAQEEITKRIDLKIDYELENGNSDIEELEKKWGESSTKEFKIFMALSEEITKRSNGIIDPNTAREMIRTKRSELRTLFQKMA